MTVDLAREAAARGEWVDAYALLRDAGADRGDDPELLALTAQVAYAAGDLDATIEAWERLHSLCVAAGERAAAGGAAVRVAMHLLLDTALMAPVRGWLARADRLLEDEPEASEHAWLAVVRTYERMLAGDVDGARPWSEQAIAVGSRHDPAACAVGRVAAARLRILGGDVEEGLALLDEAGVAAVSGDLDPIATGLVYCELVCALQGLAQYDVAEQWTEAMERWCRTNAIGSIHGRCRLHKAEILRLRGHCDDAEREALAACEELTPYLRREMGWPLRELGRIRLRRGDVDGAEEALMAAHRAGWDPQPDLALLQLARGRPADAVSGIRGALEHPAGIPSKEQPPDTELQRAPLLEAQVEIELAAGDTARAAAAATALEEVAGRFRSKALLAGAGLARARVQLAEGLAAEAERSCTDAVRMWNEIGAPYEVACARAVLAQALRIQGRDESAEMEIRAATALLEGIETASPRPANVLRREGDYWSVTFRERTVRVRDLKGIRYLAQLMAQPGHELHVLDLVAAETGVRAEPGDAGELLDDSARAAYRRRLDEIEEDIRHARALGDAGREAQADAERDFLLRELASAVGLGGRPRRAVSASERARAAVTRAIRQAIARIAEHHAELGLHLDRSVRTGTRCVYAPEATTPADRRRTGRGYRDAAG